MKNFQPVSLKKVLLLSVIVLIVSAVELAAQTIKSTISGIIKDSTENKSLTYVTVELYKGKVFNTPVRSAYSGPDGKFEMTKVDTGSYTLIFTYTGYAEKLVNVQILVPGTTLDLATIFLHAVARNLQGVTITARKPLVEQSDDKVTYNAENDPLASAETATDILRKTPLVSVDGEGNVQVNGQTNFKILLNGRETAMFASNIKEALKGFPGTLIKKIEVITNPSAKYDAEGIGGLINIITKKKVAGFNGNVYMGYNIQGNIFPGGSLNFKKGKLGIAANLNMNNSFNLKGTSEEKIESYNPVAFSKRITSGNHIRDYGWRQGNLEISYDLDSINTVNTYLAISGGYFNSQGVAVQQLYYPYSAAPAKSTFNTVDKNKYPSFNTGVDFIHKYKTNPEKEFSIKLNGNFGKNEQYSESELHNVTTDRFAINETYARNKEYTVQSDYIHPLKKKRKIEMGLKAIFRQASSVYESLVKYFAADEYKVNPFNTDNFSYHQNVYSAYSTYSFILKKFNFRLGARMEHTEVKGAFESSPSIIRQKYTNLVPNALISTRLKNGHNISIGYSLRLQRPFIFHLNPFVNNSDSLNVSKGNPGLTAQTFHSVTLQYRFSKGKTFVNLGLTNSFSQNRIVQYSIFDDNTGITTTSPANIGKSMQIGLSGNVNTSITTKWTLSTFLRLAYDDIENTKLSDQGNAGLSGNMNVNTAYTITTRFGISAYGGFFRNAVTIQGKTGANAWYGCGFNYKFLNDKLTTTINATNFHAKYFGQTQVSADKNFSREYEYKYPFRGLSFYIAWNFGKLKDASVSKKKGVNNDDLISQ